MSEENVEVVRRLHDAYAQGDVQAGMSCFDPDVEFSPPSLQPGASIYHGHEGVRRATVIWVGTWEDFRMEVEELTDLGEQVLARVHEYGRGKGSGVGVDRQLFQLFQLREQKIVRLRMFEDKYEALEAAGLSE